MARQGVGTALLAVSLAAVLAGCSHGSATGSSAAPTTSPPTAGPAVIAVKIDNVDAAQPSTGLAAAEAVYVEPVEAGLTRLVAVFAQPPQVVGPLRSARQTDLNLLSQYGRPTFAYSGSVPQLQGPINAASVVNASQAAVPKAYFRGTTHPAPHNLYVRPARLPAGTGPRDAVLPTGPAPSGGTPTTDQRVRYPHASYEFRWSAPTGRWLVWMDGTPYRCTDSGQLGAATVVVQRVTTHPEAFPEDSSGAVAPVAQTIGTGSATVLRDGRAFPATWSRPTASAATRYAVTGSGASLPLAPGPVWVLIVPA
jgi:hypothetical protein